MNREYICHAKLFAPDRPDAFRPNQWACHGAGGASYPRPDLASEPVPLRVPTSVVRTDTVGIPPARGDRWGSRVGGRWWGGANAPGGWPAYRRPVRGMTVPSYWNDRRFGVDDWAVYTLPQPPVGYHWSRYYDDAVLLDERGSVYDSVYGVNWDGGSDYAYAPRRPGVRTGLAVPRSVRSRAGSRAIGWVVR